MLLRILNPKDEVDVHQEAPKVPSMAQEKSRVKKKKTELEFVFRDRGD